MTTAPCPVCNTSADEGGWCGCCGADLRPGSTPGRFSRVASERSALWANDPEGAKRAFTGRTGQDPGEAGPAAAVVVVAEQPEPGTDPKTCPRCAEDVKAAAEVCRFCGHEFEKERSSAIRPSDRDPDTPTRTRGGGSLGETSTLAVIALACALTGISVVAIPLGLYAQAEIDGSGGKLRGRELATVAVWIGAIVLPIQAIVLLSILSG